ncbi:MAG: hypothetical protein JW776_05550 [Candidatus Lokiarchaeota archaeon]|nr:hypothetical protein [Candidatus Lokiarchaeota archaeon]
MRKPFIFLIFILSGLFWHPIPYYEEVYLYDQAYIYILSAGLGKSTSIELSGVTNISLELEISSETNFTVIIDYCMLEENDSFVDYIAERGLTDLIHGEKGDFNFFVLFIRDPSILTKINSSVAYNRIEPNLTTHFQFNCSLTDGSTKVWMYTYAGYYSGITYNCGLLVSYTYYLLKLNNWMWISPLVAIVAFFGFIIPYALIKKRRREVNLRGY